MSKTSLGFANGAAVQFEPEVYPFLMTDVVLLADYTRNPTGVSMLPLVFSDTEVMGVGGGIRIGINEAAELVRLGVARYS